VIVSAGSIVRGAPGRIPQELPCGVDGCHPRDAVGARDVGVIFLREPPVRSLDHLVLGLGVDLEDLVRIHRGGRLADVALTSEGRHEDERDQERVPAKPGAVGSAQGGAAPSSAPGVPSSGAPRQRWRITYRRDPVPADLVGRAALDAWQAGIRASGLPVAVADTDPTRARLAFAAPLPAAARGERELVDLWLLDRIPAWRLRESLAGALPTGHHWRHAEDVWLAAPALPGQVVAADWHIEIELEDGGPEAIARLETSARALLASRSIERTRIKSGSAKRYDLRPLIETIGIEAGSPPVVVMRTRFDPERGAGRPEDVMAALGERSGVDVAPTAITRLRLVLAGEVRAL
jgi:radical SAM-linked protein